MRPYGGGPIRVPMSAMLLLILLFLRLGGWGRVGWGKGPTLSLGLLLSFSPSRLDKWIGSRGAGDSPDIRPMMFYTLSF